MPPHGDLHQKERVSQENYPLHATRETHHWQSPARAVPGNTKKTVLDARNGYHSVALAESDRHFTTFIAPWGRYRYRSAPQGYIASGDAYTARYDALVAHIPRKTKCIDDVLLWSAHIEAAFHQVTEWLDMCAKNGITLNPRKFRFAKDEVEFSGFDITLTDVKPSQKYLDAIPLGITDVRAWFSLLNQVAYAFSMAPVMLPFRDLLKPSFTWTDHSSSKHSPRRSQRSATESRREFVFLTRTDPPVWQRTGVRTGSGTGSSRNTASARLAKSSVVRGLEDRPRRVQIYPPSGRC